MPGIFVYHLEGERVRPPTILNHAKFNHNLLIKTNSQHTRPPSSGKKFRAPFFKWLWLAVFLQIFWCLPAAAAAKSPSVVILSSYHQGYEWSDKELAGLLERLHQDYPRMDPAIEYLDAKRFPGRAQEERMRRYLAGKYRGRKVGLVIVLDNSALDLALHYRQEIFPGVPLVFAGINDFSPAMLQGQKKVTGVTEAWDIAGALELALSLHPGAKEVLVIHDYTNTGLAARREVEILLPAFEGRLKVSFTPPATFQEILEQVKSLPPGSIGLITAFATDRLGVSLSQSESTRLLTAAEVPFYSMTEPRLGQGIVGGVLLGGREHGRRAGEIALKVLAGEDPARIPVDTKSTAKPMFDYLQLARFRIPLKALPEGSLVINRPVSFYGQNKKWIWGISATVVFLSLVIFILSTNIVRRRWAEKALLASEISLRSVIDCTGEAILTVDRNRLITAFNPAFTRLLDYTAEEVLGQSVSMIHRSLESFQKFGEMAYPAIAATGSWKGELELKKKDGTLIPTELSLAPQRLPDGTLMGYIGAHRDISERLRSEEQIKIERQILRDILEATLAGYWDWDISNNTEYLSPTFKKMFGYEDAELPNLPETWQTLIFPEDLAIVREIFDRHVQSRGEVPYYNEVRYRHKNGETVWVICAGQVIEWDEAGQPLRMVGCHVDITARRKAEEELRESEARLRTLYETVQAGIMLQRADGKILHANQVACDIFGMEFGEILGRTSTDKVWQMVLEDGTPVPGKEHPSMITIHTGQPIRNAIRGVFAKDPGRMRWLLINTEPIFDQKKEKLREVTITFQDITELKRAEEKLRQSEEKYRLVFENAPLGIMHYDQDGTITDLNTAFTAISGAPKERIVGFNMPRQLRDEQMRQAVEASLKGETGYYEGEYLSVTGGRATQVRAFYRGIFSEPGTFLGGIGMFEDYTDKFRAEQKQLEYLNFLQTLMDAIPNPIFYKDIEGRYLGCNKACEDAWGISREELIGKTVFDQHPRDLAAIYYARDMELLNRPGVQVYETSMAHTDGTRKDVIIHKATFSHLDGTLAGLIGIQVDITARKRAEERILSSLQEKEVLLKEIHHRVKNNLQIISTLLALQIKYRRNQDPGELFQDCQNRIRSMALIHESLYSTENLARINFRHYLEKLSARLLASYGSMAQGIKIAMAGTHVHLDVSQAVPCGLIANELLVNSLKHAFPGRKEGEIQVSIEDTAGRRVLEVRDNGVGLGPDFDLENPTTFGWMMVRNLAKQLGGDFMVQSNGGTSTRIVF